MGPPKLMLSGSRKRPAKLFHKKARTGCSSCRLRRVKCDETKPVCLNCNRLSLECSYEVPKPRTNPGSLARLQSPSGVNNEPDLMRLPETEERRRLELELFYHYFTVAGHTISPESPAQAYWVDAMCQAATRSDAVMHCVCLISSLHKAHKSAFTDANHMAHASRYLAVALHEHNRDVQSINEKNVEYACLASSALRVYRWVELQKRSLKPYTPPVDWLRLSVASRCLFDKAEDMFAGASHQSITHMMVVNAKSIASEQYNHKHSDVLAHLLRREQPHELEEPWDDDTAHVYRAICSLVGGFWWEKDNPEAIKYMRRVIGMFPILVSNHFIQLVEERRPRALVILAHYFAVLSVREYSWFIGNSGAQETRAIAEYVPTEWHHMLHEPLAILADRSWESTGPEMKVQEPVLTRK